MVRAVLFDFGGVITTSPFDAFAAYERRVGVPEGTVRSINATDPHTNAWARLERGELDVTRFVEEFDAEARAAGHELSGAEVLACLTGELRPAMVGALRRLHGHVALGLLTNNHLTEDHPPLAQRQAVGEDPIAEVLGLFDVVVESARLGVRKPERRFYELALERIGVEAPDAVFLDDLGINLKPAAAMGMATIKVVDPDEALAELEELVGIALR